MLDPRARSTVELQNGEIDGSLTLAVAEIDVGTGLDEKIYNDTFLDPTGGVKVQVAMLLQGDSALEVELCQVYECFLIEILSQNICLHPRIKNIHATEEFHDGVL